MQIHSGVQTLSPTAARSMNKQSLAVGCVPLDSGCEQGWLWPTLAHNSNEAASSEACSQRCGRTGLVWPSEHALGVGAGVLVTVIVVVHLTQSYTLK